MSARVLFEGTHGISVNSQIRVRDQERSAIAADIKRIRREKSNAGFRTFALTADVADAHARSQSARESAPEGQCTSTLSAPSVWPQHPTIGQE